MQAAHSTWKRLWFPMFALTLFAGLFFISMFRLFWYTPVYIDQLIASDVIKLARIIEHIDARCEILSVERQRVYIDFLNVKDFDGSELAPLNLAYPREWPKVREELREKGYDLSDNPTIQEKEYQLVRTRDGYFIVPGDGVRLSNGDIIGQDVVFDENSDIPGMIRPDGILFIDDKALGAPVNMKSNPVKAVLQENIFRPDISLEIDTLAAKTDW